jgi:hypothetical protein
VTSQTAAAPAAFDVIAASVTRARDLVLSVRTVYVLGAFVLAQWAALLVFALTVRHNGWLYYAGGDQLWHYSGAYLLAHGHLPPAFVGYGWSILLLPFAAVAGPNIVSALPAIVLLNTLVLAPVALLCVYGIASRIAGRLFGYWTALLWIALPYLGILFVEPGYHQKYTELTLPQLLGLSSVPDYPSTVALLVAGYFCLRALDSPTWYPAAAAGLATGYSLAIKPSNSIFLFAPALLFLVLRWRAVIPFALALAPPLLTLALWKYRGLGQLAAAPAEPMPLASGVGGLGRRIYNPDLNSWNHLHQVLLGLREHFWASRVMEWLPLAGLVALLLRSRRGFLLLAPWFVAYLLLKGTYDPASVDDASFWRILMPAYPAFLMLAASVALLVPRVRARPAPAMLALHGRRLAAAAAAAALVFAILPLGVIAAVPPLHDGGTQALSYGAGLLPVARQMTLRIAPGGQGAVKLSWQPQSAAPASVFYRVLRTNLRGGLSFCAGRLNNAADNCQFYAESVGTTRGTTFVDHPGTGEWMYRIGVSANWLDDIALGDVTVLSLPAVVSRP